MKALVIILCSMNLFASDCQIGGTKGQRVTVEVGDSSCDGHCKNESFNFCTSFNRKKMSEVFAKALKKIGSDYTREVEEYEDSTISKKSAQKLIEYGIDSHYFECEGESKEACYFSSENSEYSPIYSYVLVFLNIIKKESNDFEYKFLKNSKTLHLGGYGFFSP